MNYFILALLAGIIGAIMGIGGGIIIVPALTLIFNIPIHYAIGASITAVVATSSTSASSYVKEGISNIRLGMFLESGTTFGALVGAIITTAFASSDLLFVLFALLLVYASYSMITSAKSTEESQFAERNDRMADILQLQGHYFDKKINKEVNYYVDRTPHMLGVSVGAGIASGLLGVGGGFIKVPALVKVSKVPIKAASATSNFMIGVTASTSALVYLGRNYIDPFIAGPVALGTLFGALIGVRLFKYIHGNTLKVAFGILLILISIQLFMRGLSINIAF
ncbi:MAG: sulfite exporter TauE/SafE family protein [Candidatus Thorarchaeota archaeon]